MSRIRTADLIRKYYQQAPLAHALLLDHSRRVCRKALTIARHLNASQPVDLEFIAEAAMLHDIGMIFTHAPEVHCFGELPYLAHGIKGAEMLRAEGLPRHARVCERHTGVGLTAAEIRVQQLPLPHRDLLPETLEERIICYADLFFSKNRRDRGREKTPAKVRKALIGYGAEKGPVFDAWHREFGDAEKGKSI